jgi:ankyrin repeat protein
MAEDELALDQDDNDAGRADSAVGSPSEQDPLRGRVVELVKRPGCWVATIAGLGGGAGLVALLVLVAMVLQLEGCSIEVENCSDSDDPVIAAASRGDVTELRDELSDGADPDREVDGETALSCVTDEAGGFLAAPPPGAGRAALVEVLLDAGAEPTPEALENAARSDTPDIIRLLLDAGAEPTPDALRNAAGVGELETVTLLLDAGVEVPDDSLRPTFCGVMDLGVAVVPVESILLALSEVRWGTEGQTRLEIAGLLLEGGAHPDGGPSGPSPLLCSAFHGYVSAETFLLENGVDVDHGGAVSSVAVNTLVDAGFDDEIPEEVATLLPERREGEIDNLPPLVGAAWAGRTAAATRLLDAGADPNLAADDAFTPLLGAALLGKSELVEALLDAGAVPVPTVRDGVPTPAEAARAARHDEIAATLDAAAAPETN